MRLRTLIPAALATSIILAGCGGSDSADPTPTPPPQSTRTATIASGGDTTPISSPATVVASPSPATPSATVTTGASPALPSATPAGSEATPTRGAANTPAPPTPTPPPATGNPASAIVGVTGSVRYFWAPANAIIAPGGTVTFSWDSNAVHDLSIPALGIATSPKKQYTQTVTFANPGSYAFVCEVHADTMAGTITVQ